MQVITKNALKCKLCGDIIESKTVHDFQRCTCGKCFIDGGHEYVRAGFDKLTDIEWMTEYVDLPGYHVSYAFRYPDSQIFSFDTTKPLNELIEAYSDYYLKIESEDKTKVLFDSFEGER